MTRKTKSTRTPATACPAAAIGRQLEAVLAEQENLKDKLEPVDDRGSHWWAVHINNQLEDRAEALRSQLEWVRATSVAGVRYQFIEFAEKAYGGRPDDRGIRRLKVLIYDALTDLSKAPKVSDDFCHGLDLLTEEGPFANVLQRHTGVDVSYDRPGFGGLERELTGRAA